MSELQQQPAEEGAIPTCPKCKGEMWDNRVGKKNPKAPDFKCKDRSCDGVIWPPRDAAAKPAAPAGTPDDPACPVCGGKMWDDRLSKRNPKAPDFKCRNKPRVMGGPGCPGVIWPPREGERGPGTRDPGLAARPATQRAAPNAARPTASAHEPPPPDDRDFDPSFADDDDLPF